MFMVCVCVFVYMCQGAHVEVREHLAGVSSLLTPCSVLWIGLESSDLCILSLSHLSSPQILFSILIP